MAKMRVNELARELEVENKQIIEFLSTTEYAVKSHSSSVEENVQALVREKFGKRKPKAEKPAEAVKPEKSIKEAGKLAQQFLNG